MIGGNKKEEINKQELFAGYSQLQKFLLKFLWVLYIFNTVNYAPIKSVRKLSIL
jgi:hypothetical protein